MGGSRWARNSFVYLLILVILVITLFTVIPRGGSSTEVPIVGGPESLIGRIQENQGDGIGRIEVDGEKITLWMQTGENFTSRLPEATDFFEFLDREGVDVSDAGFPNTSVSGGGGFSGVLNIFLGLLPLIIIVGVVIFIMRQAQGSNSQAMSFGKSKARVVTANRPSVTFNDVAGAVEAKQELQEVVEFLKFPERFAALGARIPTGVLLVGPPGTGKTLISRAVAGEAGVPFFSISGSEFVEMFVGVGREPGARSVRASEEERALHRVHR